MAEGNSAAGKVSSPDHINVSSKKVFSGARKSATRNACAMFSRSIMYCIFCQWNFFGKRLFQPVFFWQNLLFSLRMPMGDSTCEA